MRVLVDTDIISYAFKKSPFGERYESFLQQNQLCISFISVAELERWAIKFNWGDLKRHRLKQFVRRFSYLEHSYYLSQQWAKVIQQRENMGHPLAHADGWIAATAVLYQIPLLTHNIKDYMAIDGLQLLPESAI